MLERAEWRERDLERQARLMHVAITFSAARLSREQIASVLARLYGRRAGADGVCRSGEPCIGATRRPPACPPAIRFHPPLA